MPSLSGLGQNFTSSAITAIPSMGNSALNFGRTAANNTAANVASGGQMAQSVGAIQGSVYAQEQYMEQITELTNELALKNAQCNIEKKLGEAAKSLTQ